MTGRLRAGLLLAFALSPALAADGDRARLVEYGWDVPTPAFARDHVREMEARPFDGVVLRLTNHGLVFGGRRWPGEETAADLEALRAIPWERFTDNFLMMLATSEMDWFRASDWRAVRANVRAAARAAREGRLAGLVFDPEPYGKNPWRYPEQARAGRKSFDQYASVVRRRGATFARAIRSEFPGARLLLLFGWSQFRDLLEVADPSRRRGMLESDFYGLLPAFLEGLLEGAGPGMTIVDGNELSYFYSEGGHYAAAREVMEERALRGIDPGLRSRYRRLVRPAHALFADYAFALWEEPCPAAGWTPEERARRFEESVYQALTNSGAYVWLFSQRMNWWTGEGLPPGIDEAVRRARERAAAEAR